MKTKTTPKVITVIVVLALILSMASCAKSAPTAEVFISQGDKYLASGDYDKAEDAYTSAIKLNKKLTAAWLGRGDAYFGLEDFESAIEDYEQVIDLDDELVDAYIKLADCYVELEDEEEAIRWLQEGYDITESSKLLRKLEKLQGEGPAQSGKNSEVRGNTAANIMNYGFATVDERGTLYVTYPSVGGDSWGSVQTNDDGTMLVVGFYLNVVDGYIYFTDDEYGGQIYKMRTDGSELTALTEDVGMYLSVVDGWIYFAGEDDAGIYDCAIYKMKTDGTGREKLEFDMDYDDNVDEDELGFTVVDGWIYWFAGEYDAHEHIYRMKTDGSATEKFELDGDGWEDDGWEVWEKLIVDDGWMYYTVLKETDDDVDIKMRRTRVDGSKTEVIYSDSGNFYDTNLMVNVNIAGDWLYCLGSQQVDDYEHDFSIYRMKTDGTEITKLATTDEWSATQWGVCVADGRIINFQQDEDGVRMKSSAVTGGDESEAVTIYKYEYNSHPALEKPVIYLYPEQETEVSVSLGIDQERFIVTYPEYNGSWSVVAQPDGTLIDKRDGNEYSYLFWEAEGTQTWSFYDGFIVKSSEAAEFLREKLSYMGLTPKEYNDFIVYWLPRLQQNEYNLIRFVGAEYTDEYPLNISPEPDSVLRVFMVWKEANGNETIAPQELPRFNRQGFTVVEWGGAEVG